MCTVNYSIIRRSGSLKGGRPSAREASRFLLSSPVSVAAGRWNSLLMQFGQFIVHDISKTSILPTDQCPLCSDIPGKCFPIKVDPSDQRFGCQQPPCCLGFTRSAPVCGLQPRIRLNENTAFIDGSQIYSSSSLDAARLRDQQSAFLRQTFFNNKPFMPFDSNQCFGPGSCTANFDTGDNRVSIFVGLAALHTIFLREHNRLASDLRRLNPQWSDERVFQESRKIVGAQLQIVTSKFWLTKVLGSDEPLGPYKGYDPSVNPTIADEFANGAMRFGHGMVQEFFARVDAGGQSIPEGQMRVDTGVLQPQKLLFEGGPDAIVRGMMMTALKKPQRLTTALTENMFGTADLGAVNIQRGRDAGVPGYNTWREFCSLPRANSFDDLANEFPDPVLRNNLRQGYSHPDNVDLYVAALLEEPRGNSLVGPTIACLIRNQFKRIRDGDRFWYENPGVFTEQQLAELNKSTLARILCDNGDDFHLVVRDAFEVTDGQNLTPCQSIVSLDLRKWSD
uniref:peroxidase n=1 Tax=Romanomermis culicivorax TaxID=13658 RepID=A0A915JI24_ROMCU